MTAADGKRERQWQGKWSIVRMDSEGMASDEDS
jgi:hypothetical protein